MRFSLLLLAVIFVELGVALAEIDSLVQSPFKILLLFTIRISLLIIRFLSLVSRDNYGVFGAYQLALDLRIWSGHNGRF